MSVTAGLRRFFRPRRFAEQVNVSRVSDRYIHRYIPETRSSKVATGVHRSHFVAPSLARMSGPQRKLPHA